MMHLLTDNLGAVLFVVLPLLIFGLSKLLGMPAISANTVDDVDDLTSKNDGMTNKVAGVGVIGGDGIGQLFSED